MERFNGVYEIFYGSDTLNFVGIPFEKVTGNLFLHKYDSLTFGCHGNENEELCVLHVTMPPSFMQNKEENIQVVLQRNVASVLQDLFKLTSETFFGNALASYSHNS